jgi:hypothetical protein
MAINFADLIETSSSMPALGDRRFVMTVQVKG